MRRSATATTNRALALLLLSFSSCASYQVGNQGLYSPEVRTVYVPMFESDSLRRYLGERLTEAVVKEIELKTPYKVTDASGADSVLSGRILSDRKKILVQNGLDEGREIEVGLRVEVTWATRQSDLLRDPQSIVLPPELITIERSASFVPEAGQSLATAQQKAIDRLASEIVATMEAPW